MTSSHRLVLHDCVWEQTSDKTQCKCCRPILCNGLFTKDFPCKKKKSDKLTKLKSTRVMCKVMSNGSHTSINLMKNKHPAS